MAAPSIFISYRRDDSAGHAGRLCDRLEAAFGTDRVFRDIEDIAAGDDFVQTLHGQVDRCEVLLALIGPRWMDLKGPDGRPRLSCEDDWVRREIARGLARGIRVIPVLLQGAKLPAPAELPEDLTALSRRQALELRDTQFERDADHLISLLAPGQARLRRYRIAIGLLLVALAGVGAYAVHLHRVGVDDAARMVDDRDDKTRQVDLALATLRQQGHEFSAAAFLDAVDKGNDRAVELFLQAGMDANASEADRYPALIGAIVSGRPAMVRALLKHGADTADALGVAIGRGQDEIVTLLFAHPLPPADIQKALGHAAHQGRLDYLDRMLSLGADPNANQGDALRSAVDNAQVESLRWLLAHGAKPDQAVYDDDWTLLHNAVFPRSVTDGAAKADAMVALLLDAGMDVNARTDRPTRPYATPLLGAIQADYGAAAKRLLAAGADTTVRASDRSGASALHLAARKNQADVVRALIGHGARLEDRDKEGATALILASQNNATDALAVLIEHRSDLEARDEAGRTALHAAIESLQPEAVAALLAAGANFESRNATGNTPLLGLASRSYEAGTVPSDLAVRIAELLLAKGASPKATDAKGQTALVLAQSNHSTALVKVLRRR